MYDLLAGLRVVEVSSFVASPSAGLYLAQMGAEVVRIDPPGGGQDFRRWPVNARGDSFSWENLNRAKRSVALDLSSAHGRDLAQALAAEAGVLITNLPADGFLAHGRLAARRPDMVSVRIMGWPDGSVALDYTANAAVGYPALTGPEDDPAPVNHVLPAWDLLAGAYAAFALLAAVRRRDATGQGGEVRLPLTDLAIASAANLGRIAEVLHDGRDRERIGNAVFGTIGRDFVTRDGVREMIVAINERQWQGLVAALDLAAPLAALEGALGLSFAGDDGLRFTHRASIFALVERKVADLPHRDLVAALDAARVPHGPYLTLPEAIADPRLVAANPLFAPCAANPSGFAYPAAGAPATLAGEARAGPRPAPQLGIDTRAVLGEWLGLSGAAVDSLIQNRIAGDIA